MANTNPPVRRKSRASPPPTDSSGARNTHPSAPTPPLIKALAGGSGLSALQAHEELQKLKDMHHGATQRRRGSVVRRQDIAKAKLAQRLTAKKAKAMNKFSALHAFARGFGASKMDWTKDANGEEEPEGGSRRRAPPPLGDIDEGDLKGGLSPPLPTKKKGKSPKHKHHHTDDKKKKGKKKKKKPPLLLEEEDAPDTPAPLTPKRPAKPPPEMPSRRPQPKEAWGPSREGGAEETSTEDKGDGAEDLLDEKKLEHEHQEFNPQPLEVNAEEEQEEEEGLPSVEEEEEEDDSNSTSSISSTSSYSASNMDYDVGEVPDEVLHQTPELLISPRMKLVGTIRWNKLLRIEGYLEGKLVGAEEATVVIGKNGRRVGDITGVRNVEVEPGGMVTGSIEAENVLIEPKGAVFGNIFADR
ncbi:hypothetical protein TrLO_g4391 [Triparma laevis f. longispina]|uniref:Uncharacterized protein n=1 Tax=Triparma laevis f. longispina TaxID=1714387 RepID=A0A9W7AS26_9STRA|nr:hypothetical protein TrLO_g4391 [Triparma laevis f. longispina]